MRREESRTLNSIEWLRRRYRRKQHVYELALGKTLEEAKQLNDNDIIIALEGVRR